MFWVRDITLTLLQSSRMMDGMTDVGIRVGEWRRSLRGSPILEAMNGLNIMNEDMGYI